jgi:glycosyltransferase involved in cell wall biosynthesis
MRRLRVLQVLPSFSPGGAERMAVHLARALDPGRFQVEFASFYDPVWSDLETSVAAAGLRLTHHGKRLGFDPRVFPRLALRVLGLRPDVIHTHLHVLPYVFPVARALGIRCVHTVHSLAEKEALAALRGLYWSAFRLGVVPVAISPRIAASTCLRYSLPGVTLIPNGIPLQEYSSPEPGRDEWRRRAGFSPQDLLVTCVANFTPAKNHAGLLQALHELAAQVPGVCLLLVGEGELRPQVEADALRLGLHERVRFLGFRTDIPAVLAASDVFALASEWEGHPLAVLEACAAGLPVAGTAVGGLPDIVEHERSGLLVPAGDTRALAGALERLLTDAGLRKALGRRASEIAAAHFGSETMAVAYGELYQAVAKGTPPPEGLQWHAPGDAP